MFLKWYWRDYRQEWELCWTWFGDARASVYSDEGSDGVDNWYYYTGNNKERGDALCEEDAKRYAFDEADEVEGL